MSLQFRRDSFSGPLIWCLTIVGTVLGSGICSGEEPVQLFLEELKVRGYYDTAVDYLDELEKSPLCPDDFRPRIPLEKAIILIEAAKGLRDLAKHDEYLNRAETLLVQFSKADPAPELKAQSEKIRSQLYFGRGLVYLKLAEGDRKTVEEKQELRKQARVHLQSAWDTLSKNAAYVRTRLESIKINPLDVSRSKP